MILPPLLSAWRRRLPPKRGAASPACPGISHRPPTTRRARRHLGRDLERWQIVGTWHGVIHVTPGQELAAFLVVDATLEEGLTDALRQTAVNLAFDDHRIDDIAEVIAGREVDDLD